MKKVLKSCVSLLLVACMLLGVVPATMLTAHAAEANGKKTIVYASIGDSMTNGYCLDGYDGESGGANYAKDTYANKFAAYLAGYTGPIADDQVIFEGNNVVVDHRQLAISGLRAEDIHWILELNYEDDALINSLYDWQWNKDTWYNTFKFNAGDYRTWNDFVSIDYRYADAAAKILQVYNTGNNGKYFESSYASDAAIAAAKNGLAADKYFPENKSQTDSIGGAKFLQIATEYYQESLKDADVISMAVGNTNFGTFMLMQMLNVVMENDTSFDKNFDLDKAKELASKDPLTSQILSSVKSNPAYTQLVNTCKDLANGNADKAARIERIVEYCVTSYFTGYVGTLKNILSINPDAKIIQVALMNAYENQNGVAEDGTLGKLVEQLYTPINSILRSLPENFKTAYKDAEFYFAEADHVSCMVDVFGDDFYKQGNSYVKYPGLLNGTEGYAANKESTVRRRFVEEIVYGPRLFAGMGLKTQKDVNTFLNGAIEYDQKVGALKGAYAAQDAGSAKEYALYLAFENALIRAGTENITMSSLASLEGLGSVFAQQSGNIMAAIGEARKNYYPDAAVVVANGSNGSLTEDNVKTMMAGVEQVKAGVWANVTDQYKAALASIGHTSMEYILNCSKCKDGTTHGDAGLDAIISAILSNYQTAVMDNVVYPALVQAVAKMMPAAADYIGVAEAKALCETVDHAAYEAAVYEIVQTKAAGMGYPLTEEQVKTLATEDGAFVVAAQLATAAGTTISASMLKMMYELYDPEKTDEENAPMTKDLHDKVSLLVKVSDGVQKLLTPEVEAKLKDGAKSIKYAIDSAHDLAYLLALPKAMSDAMCANTDLRGALTMNARCMLGTGAGGHPSTGGHTSLYNAVVASCSANPCMLGHTYEAAWTWADDGSSVTVELVCTKSNQHDKVAFEDEDITITEKVTKEATCTEAGVTLFTASVTHDEITYTGTKEVPIAALEHDFAETTYEWSEDYKTCTAKHVCKRDEKHVETANANSTSAVKTAPACGEMGTTTYTATFTDCAWATEQTKDVKDIPALDHTFGEPAWKWAEDYSSATATFTCDKNKDHINTLTATVSSVIEEETCEADGKATYTATVKIGDKTYTDEQVKVIGMSGHDYEAAWKWAEDNSDAVLTLTCKNDESHVEKPEVTVTSKTTDATCDKDGKTVYTATAEFEEDTYTDTEEVTIPAAHKFGDWTTEDDVSKRVCSACGYTESKFTTTDGNVEIELPEQADGLTLNVDQVSEDSDERYILVEETFEEYAEEKDISITVLKTFDITLENKDGVHQQPDGTLKVKLPLGSDKDGNYKVYRVDDDGKVTDMEATRQGSHMVFNTNHLSLYVIVEINEHKHDLKLNKAVDATCTADGNKAYYTCSGCDLWFEDEAGTTEIKDKTSVVVPKLDHDWKDATCTAPKTCSVCGATEGWRLRHTYEETVTEPTCTEQGYTTRTCSGCEHSYQTSFVEALGHSWDEGKVTIEATEDKAGECVFTCKTCEETKTEVIPALGHTHNYTSVVTAPTCTEKGYTTYTCACGHTYIADEVPATGHTIEKGICTVCGVEDPAEAGFFKLYGANMLLGNNLAMNFYIDPADLEFGEDYYAVITKEYADDREDLVVKIDVEDWEEAYGMYRISLDKIAAKEMADDIIVVIYNGDDEQVSKTWVDSVRDYTMRMLEKEEAETEPNEELLALYVEMLNYGAAAQDHFEYNENDLANNELTAEQKAYGVGPVEMGDFRVKGTGYVGTNLTLESNILMNFFFNNIPAEHDDMYAIATYVDHYGKAQEIKIEGENFVKHDGSTWKISVAGLVIADCKELVTVKVFDANGNVVASVVDSIESYTARMDEDGPLYVAIMKFAVAAYESFH